MKAFSVRQEHDRLPRRPLAAVIGIAIVAFGAAIAVSTALLAWWGAPRRAVPAPSPESTVERSLVRTTERGIDERRAAREALDRDIERAIDRVAADAGGSP